jgi:deazaflavin-dependent oxidoreductase (nitroreductase family)
MADWDPEAWTRALKADLREHGGRATSGPLAGQQMLVLRTSGAKSGEPREAIVSFHEDGDNIVIAASKGGAPEHPSWYYNLLAHPDATVEIGSDTLPVHATVSEGAERDRLWNDHVRVLPQFGEYPSKTSRVIPMIVLEKSGSSRA